MLQTNQVEEVFESGQVEGIGPTFTTALQPVSVVEGETVKLTCSVAGNKHYIDI